MKTTRRGLLIGLGAACVAGDAVAQAAAQQPMTPERLRQIRLKANSPALAVSAQKQSGTPVFWVDGERAAGSGVKATVDDLWHIGSITKSMTATLVARLAEAGRLSWDDTAANLLPTLAGGMQAQYRAATFRSLMSHRAGLPANIGVLDYVRYAKRNPDPRAERQDYARRALAMTPIGPAITTYVYSNNGPIIAGAMMEAKTGEPWEALIRSYVFDPLGIKSAGFGPPGTSGKLDQPLGHMKSLTGDKRRPIAPDDGNADNPAVMGPAGTVHCTLADMMRYLAAHRDRPAFLTEASWTTLHTPPFGGNYAMGWFTRSGGRLSHGGWNRRSKSVVTVDPRTGLNIFAATNDGHAASADVELEEALSSAAAAMGG